MNTEGINQLTAMLDAGPRADYYKSSLTGRGKLYERAHKDCKKCCDCCHCAKPADCDCCNCALKN